MHAGLLLRLARRKGARRRVQRRLLLHARVRVEQAGRRGQCDAVSRQDRVPEPRSQKTLTPKRAPRRRDVRRRLSGGLLLPRRRGEPDRLPARHVLLGRQEQGCARVRQHHDVLRALPRRLRVRHDGPLDVRRRRLTLTLHYITLHYITLHYITLHYIAVHYIAWHGIAWHGMAWHCMALHGMALHGIAWHCMALHCMAFIAMHCMALHGIALHGIHCNALHGIHCNALHGIALHGIALPNAKIALKCQIALPNAKLHCQIAKLPNCQIASL